MPRNGRSNDNSAAVVGRALRKVREAAGITQQEVAMHANMDRADISEVENGKRSLSVDCLLRICEGVGVAAARVVADVERELSHHEPFRVPRRIRK